jgi:hypothetical protein
MRLAMAISHNTVPKYFNSVSGALTRTFSGQKLAVNNGIAMANIDPNKICPAATVLLSNNQKTHNIRLRMG